MHPIEYGSNERTARAKVFQGYIVKRCFLWSAALLASIPITAHEIGAAHRS